MFITAFRLRTAYRMSASGSRRTRREGPEVADGRPIRVPIPAIHRDQAETGGIRQVTTRCCRSWVSAAGQANRTNGHTWGALAHVGYER